MCIPNPVYNSLDVRYIVFFYNYKFRERDDVGACCNICLGVGCNTNSGSGIGVNRANCDTIINIGMGHFYSYQIHSVRLANRKSTLAAIFQDGHEQIYFTLHKYGLNWPNSYICVSKVMF